MTTMTRPYRRPASRPDERVRRADQAYRLACPCGRLGGNAYGAAEAARLLRCHPCRPALAGPVAEPVGGGRR